MSRPPVIGIDLGTTFSCAAIFQEGTVHVIKGPNNEPLIPSYVYFETPYTQKVGKDAINASAKNPRNGIYDAKRFIGRGHNDDVIQNIPLAYPFKLVKGTSKNDEILIELQFGDKTTTIRPEEISALVLREVVNVASSYVGERIEEAVITVPAYFSNPQRQATEDAAKIAGLKVVKLLNEPTAAALAFFEEDKGKSLEKTVLVYDLGGGTFDVSIIKFKQDEGQILAVGGDAYLGGRDFDNNLVTYCLETIRRKYKYSMSDQKSAKHRRSLRRLKMECEEAKMKLSQSNSTTINLDNFDNVDVEIEITRDKFEQLNIKLFKRTLEIVENTLKGAEISKSKIDEIVLVGGSTRIPKIEQLVSDYFDMMGLSKRVNRDEGVAIGAALQAALYSNHKTQNRRVFNKLTEVIPLSLGIKMTNRKDDNFSVILKRNTPIPCEETKIYKTVRNYQDQIDLLIYEGETNNVEKNFFLGYLQIIGITKKKAGKVQIEVNFSVDDNGILSVYAIETLHRVKQKLEINLNSNRLDNGEIQKIQSKYRNVAFDIKYKPNKEEVSDRFGINADKEEVNVSFGDKEEVDDDFLTRSSSGQNVGDKVEVTTIKSRSKMVSLFQYKTKKGN